MVRSICYSHKLQNELEINKMADFSLSTILDFIVKDIPETLLNEAYSGLILAESDQLPILKHGIIEFAELPYSERVDLMICVFQNEAERLLDFLENSPRLPTEWKGILDFLKIWLAQEDILAQSLENIYMVFDNAAERDPGTCPWIYLAFRKLDLNWDILYALFIRSSAFLPGRVSNNMRQVLSTCLAKIKKPYWIFGYGLLHSRSVKKMRLGICGFIEIKQMADFLRNIGWEGNVNMLLRKMAFMDEYVDSYVLALDIGESLERRIGIECVISKQDHTAHLQGICYELTKRGLYTESRAKVLSEIPVKKKIPGRSLQTERWVNHIKLVFTAAETIEVKPYVYYNIHELS